MINVKMDVKGKKLTIEVDLSQAHGRSKSGKTITIASTQGNQKIDGPDGDVWVGLNVYKKD